LSFVTELPKWEFVEFLILANLMSKLICFIQEMKESSENNIAEYYSRKEKSRLKRILQKINQERKSQIRRILHNINQKMKELNNDILQNIYQEKERAVIWKICLDTAT
jgi:hypothetical protein